MLMKLVCKGDALFAKDSVGPNVGGGVWRTGHP